MKRINAVRTYGLLWLAAGLFLMFKGVPLLVRASVREDLPLIKFLKPLTGSSEQAAMILVVLSLVIGLIKGRTVMTKAAKRTLKRLVTLSDPLPVSQLFSLRYVLTLGIMMSLGMAIRFAHLPMDIHGLIDLAIGSALMNGGLVYFRNRSLVIGGAAPNF